MNLKTIVFQIKKNAFNFQSRSFYCLFFLPNLVNFRPITTLLVSAEGVQRDWCHNIQSLKMNRYDFTDFDTGFSQKTIIYFLIFVKIKFFVDVRHFLDNWRCHMLFVDE